MQRLTDRSGRTVPRGVEPVEGASDSPSKMTAPVIGFWALLSFYVHVGRGYCSSYSRTVELSKAPFDAVSRATATYANDERYSRYVVKGLVLSVNCVEGGSVNLHCSEQVRWPDVMARQCVQWACCVSSSDRVLVRMRSSLFPWIKFHWMTNRSDIASKTVSAAAAVWDKFKFTGLFPVRPATQKLYQQFHRQCLAMSLQTRRCKLMVSNDVDDEFMWDCTTHLCMVTR